MELNPYAPTKASLKESGQGDDEPLNEARLASRPRRFANSLIDSVGLIVFGSVIAGGIVLVAPSFIDLLSGLAGHLFQIAIVLLYFVPAEFLTGRTPGKLITRTRVVTLTGGKPSVGQIVGRTLLRLIPLEAVTFLAHGPGLHDRASGTRVIYND